MTTGLAALALAFATGLSAPSPSTSPLPSMLPPPASPAPREIFERTFEKLQSYPVPAYAVWSDSWKTVQTPKTPHGEPMGFLAKMRYAVRSSDGAENGVEIPEPGSTLPPALIAPQFLGPLAFSLRSAQTPRADRIAMQPDIPAPLKTIARVTAYAPPSYAIENAGIQTVAGHQTYHLRLRALADPSKHNLRDLWVDVDTFDLWEAHFTGIYAPTPQQSPSSSDVTALFAPIGPYWVVSGALWTWDDYLGGASFVYAVTTNDMTFPASLPDWLFDRKAYERHQRAGEADYLSSVLPVAASPVPAATPTPKR